MVVLDFESYIFLFYFLLFSFLSQGEPREDGGQMGVGSGANCYLHEHTRVHISVTTVCVYYALTVCANPTEHHSPPGDFFFLLRRRFRAAP